MSKKVPFPYPPMSNRRGADTLNKSPAYWEKKGKKMALSLFTFMKDQVPAYKKFLKAQGAIGAVRTMADFKKIPLATKDSYLRTHKYAELFPPLGLYHSITVSATSGSTGEPFFFPRGVEHDYFYERAMEVLLRTQWDVGKRSPLCILGFGLGIWIGGIFTYRNFSKLAESRLPMTLIPVGPNKELYLKSFKKFSEHFDQVILMGYPPFIKDVLDAGKEHGIDWKRHRLRILTAAEGYSERFRNHLAALSGADPVRDMVNIYGTVEQGTIAHETALGNMIRRIAFARPDVFAALFPDAQNIPTLAQYYPDHVYFEAADGGIVATGYGSSIPLVRYSFNDLGGVISFAEMKRKLSACGIDMEREAKKYGISKMMLPLPFVYVHARGDFVIVFRGANIYPEELRNALDSKVLERWVTGRFTAVRVENATHDPVLTINVEMQKGIQLTGEMREAITERLVSELRQRNSEYAYLYSLEQEKVIPHVVGRPHGDMTYFSGQGKQEWVRKT